MWISTSRTIRACFGFLREAQTAIHLYAMMPTDKDFRRNVATLFDCLPETRNNLQEMRTEIKVWQVEQKILRTKPFVQRVRDFRKSYAPVSHWLRMIDAGLKYVASLELELQRVTKLHPLWR